jgi:hypothetical protein
MYMCDSLWSMLIPLCWYAALSGGLYVSYMVVLRTPYIGPESALLVNVLCCGTFVGAEVIQATVSLILQSRSRRGRLEGQVTQPCLESGGRTAVVVTAHNAFDSLLAALPTIIRAFPAQDIWIADNGDVACSSTKALCESRGLNYVFYDIGNKTNAIVQTVRILKERLYRHVLLLDDDTLLCDDFAIRHDLLAEPLVAGYCVGIKIQKNLHSYNLWEHLVDLEYRTISYKNGIRAYLTGTIPFIHGICAVYNLDRMLPIYDKLCTLPGGLPFGEDSFAGVDFRMAGYRLLQDNVNTVSTFCPTRLLPPPSCKNQRSQGFGASSLFKQRALRWYLSWPRRLPSELALLLTYYGPSGPANVFYRLDAVYQIAIIVTSSVWPLSLIHIWLSKGSWEILGILHAMFIGSSILNATVRYNSFPRALKQDVRASTLLLNPLMNLVVTVLMGISFLLSMLWYIPLYRVDYRRCYSLV